MDAVYLLSWPVAAAAGMIGGVDSFVSVYVDMSAGPAAVRAAVAQLPLPDGVSSVEVDDRPVTDTFGCRIAVDLTGRFDEQTQGCSIARTYAKQLSAALGAPAFALYDLIRRDLPVS